jgi:hypothetical protein
MWMEQQMLAETSTPKNPRKLKIKTGADSRLARDHII